MKLHTKLLLSILASLGLVYGLALVFQQILLSRRVSQLAETNLQHEEHTEWRIIDNLQRACNTALNDAMVSGEMDRFRQLLAEQTKIDGLQELTIFNKDGVAKDSTLPALLKTVLPDDLKRRFQQDSSPWKVRDDSSFVLYQPMPVNASCLECHANYKALVSGGLYRYRFSTAGLKESQAQWAEFGVTLNRANSLAGLVTAIVLLLTGSSVIFWLVRRQIAAPLTRVSSALSASVTELSDSARAISVASQNLAEGSQSQAASLEETSASLEETTSMSRRTAEDAAHAKEAAGATRAAAETARAAMQQMSARMEGIQKATVNVAKVLKTIDEIAFQTNILALNAAVEAARAGESGAGFAVVAEEVRSLAQRCAAAARSTADMTGQVTAQVDEGAAITQQVANHLSEILTRVENEDGLIRQISEAARDQGMGLTQVSDAIISIDKVTQANAGVSENTASAAQELHAHAEVLTQQVSDLLLILNGTASTAASPDAPSTILAPVLAPRRIESKKMAFVARPTVVPGRSKERVGSPALKR